MLKKIGFVLCGLMALIAPARADKGWTPDDFSTLVGLFPSTENFAKNHRLPITGIQGFSDSELKRGDSSVLLVSFKSKHEAKQWLVTLEVADLTAEEKSNKIEGASMYLATGSHFFYPFVPLALNVVTYGPFTTTSKEEPALKTARIVVNKENLGVGLDQSCHAFVRVNDIRKTEKKPGPVGMGSRPWPYSETEIATARASLAKFNFTSEEEKSFAGTVPALLSFFDLGRNTPGLSDILSEVVTFPSLWSVVKRKGRLDVNMNMNAGNTQQIPGPAALGEIYFMPLALAINQQVALQLGLVVTMPRVPLLNTAGILKMYAKSPTQDDRMAYVEVIGAQSAASALTAN